MRGRGTQILASVAGVSLAVVGLAGPSTATETNAVSGYLAGYLGTWSGQSTDIVVKGITIPKIDCSGSNFQGVVLGAGSEPTAGHPEYLGGVWVACVGGAPSYTLEALAGGVDDMDATVTPGDNVQIVISLQCHSFPTCDIMSDVTDTDNDTNVHSETTATLTGRTTIFGALPLFGSTAVPAPVPSFATVRLQGCLFQNHLIAPGGVQKVNRKNNGTVEIKTGKIKVGSFDLTAVSP